MWGGGIILKISLKHNLLSAFGDLEAEPRNLFEWLFLKLTKM